MMTEVRDSELLSVIKDFLEMGHVENIAAMFRSESRYLLWTGDILDDERFNVRLGVSVLFEELKTSHGAQLDQAIPSLLPLLASEKPHIRGEAVSVLGIIATPEAKALIKKMRLDSNPQVREITADILQEMEACSASPTSRSNS
jgi:hypothetical protein